MPPESAATYMTPRASVGSTTTPFTRPVEDGEPGAWPNAIGEGPIAVHVFAFNGMDVDGTVRSSNSSTERRVCGRGRRTGDGRRLRNGFSQERRRRRAMRVA